MTLEETEKMAKVWKMNYENQKNLKLKNEQWLIKNIFDITKELLYKFIIFYGIIIFFGNVVGMYL